MSDYPGLTQPAQPSLTQNPATTQNVPQSRPTNLNYGLLGPYNTLATDLSFNQQGPYRFGGMQPFSYMGAQSPAGAQTFGYGGYNPYQMGYGMPGGFSGFGGRGGFGGFGSFGGFGGRGGFGGFGGMPQALSMFMPRYRF